VELTDLRPTFPTIFWLPKAFEADGIVEQLAWRPLAQHFHDRGISFGKL